MIKREGMNRKEYGDVSGFPFVKTKKHWIFPLLAGCMLIFVLLLLLIFGRST